MIRKIGFLLMGVLEFKGGHSYKLTFSHIKKLLHFSFMLILLGCVDPIEPEFDFKEDLVYVDAFVSTTPGSSFVNISKSYLDHGRKLEFEFLSGASVSYRNVDTNEVIVLEEDEGTYVPPQGFVASEGDVYELYITLADGRKYRSEPEKVTKAVDIANIKSSYDPELVYKVNSDSYVPGHRILVDVDDPPQENNYYFWRFRSFENLTYCASCTGGKFRNGECVDNPYDPRGEYAYFNYLCETDCWRIRFNENIKLFADSFGNGNYINNLEAAEVLLYTKENIVVEVQQYSLSKQAYKYYKIIKDLVDNNSGLNAPPPAALVGNMYNPDDEGEHVLGRFTAAAASTRSIFIDRSSIGDEPIEPLEFPELETTEYVCPPPGPFSPPCSPVTKTVCLESRYRTANKPNGWVD